MQPVSFPQHHQNPATAGSDGASDRRSVATSSSGGAGSFISPRRLFNHSDGVISPRQLFSDGCSKGGSRDDEEESEMMSMMALLSPSLPPSVSAVNLAALNAQTSATAASNNNVASSNTSSNGRAHKSRFTAIVNNTNDSGRGDANSANTGSSLAAAVADRPGETEASSSHNSNSSSNSSIDRAAGLLQGRSVICAGASVCSTSSPQSSVFSYHSSSTVA